MNQWMNLLVAFCSGLFFGALACKYFGPADYDGPPGVTYESGEFLPAIEIDGKTYEGFQKIYNGVEGGAGKERQIEMLILYRPLQEKDNA